MYNLYRPFQIIFCLLDYVLLYFLTANLLLLIVLTSSESR